MAILTVNPSLDGLVYHSLGAYAGIDWADLLVAAGNGANYTDAQGSITHFTADFGADKWANLLRSILLFDTSSIPVGATILAATLSVYGYEKVDTGSFNPITQVYSSNPASDSVLVPADFTTLGSTPFCDSPIAYADFVLDAYNDFVLNAAGIAAISTTGLTKLGFRNANYDVAGISPTWQSIKSGTTRIRFNEEIEERRPKLVITYSLVVVPTATTDPATSVESAAATPNGTLNDDGGEACDCGFEWGETDTYGNTTPTQSRTTGQTFAQVISGLDPGQTYHFRAFATNAAGTSYGADRTFTTLVVAPTVTTDPATALSAIAATPNGTLDTDGGEACDCGFEWGLDTGYGTTTPTQSKTTIETFSQVIGGLFPGTTYHFRAIATNSAGTSYGADRTFATALVISRAYALARREL
ncbi:hypothetical protein ES703_101478 [subsurface metagenome]